MRITFFLIAAFFTSNARAQNALLKDTVPLGGNSWLSTTVPNGLEAVTDAGWQNWSDPGAVWSSFIYVSKPGVLKIEALLQVPSGESETRWTIGSEMKKIKAQGSSPHLQLVGEWEIDSAGYVRIDATGVSRTGKYFAEVTDLVVSGTAVSKDIVFVKNNDDNYFYWGRRGPSVHLNYDVSGIHGDIDQFYCEIRVPEGNDVIGSYYMADGFGEGYFGMQVNSDSERRVLFSVWSPFQTDDPKAIPEDKKIALLQKGDSVHTGEFGNEGSGGQSFLRYQWRAGNSYGFLLKGVPVDQDHTRYTAWFYDPEKNHWMLIASFSRPATHTYLKHLYSFLENFDPTTGYLQRRAYYQNQWVHTVSGKWQPLTRAHFSYDATAKNKYRIDYQGAVLGDAFYLQNCGFFSDSTQYGLLLTRPASGNLPADLPADQ